MPTRAGGGDVRLVTFNIKFAEHVDRAAALLSRPGPLLGADVLAHVPSARLMIGSDLPESLETEMSKIITLETTREVKADILWNTAARLFAQAS